MESYTKQEKLAYLIGMAGQNILYAAVSTGVGYYYQSVLLFPSIAVGTIFALAQVVDTLKDPLMGALLDRTDTKWGKCRPYLLFSPLFVGLLTAAVFTGRIYGSADSLFGNTRIFLSAAFVYFLWCLAFTFADVPMWTLPSLMTRKERDRTALLSLAKIAGAVGSGISSVMMVPAAQYLGGRMAEKTGDSAMGMQRGFMVTAAVTAAVGAALFQLTGFFARERVTAKCSQKTSFQESFRMMSRCKPFRRLLLSGLLRSPAQLTGAVMTVLLAYYYGNNGEKSYIPYLLLFGGGFMIGQLFASAATPKLLERTAKEPLYKMCSFAGAAPLVFLFLLYCFFPNSMDEVFPVMIMTLLLLLSGFSQGAVQALQAVMTADAVDAAEEETGVRPDGVFFSGQTMLVKASGAVSSLISGVVYAVSGFSGGGVKQVNDALYSGAHFKSDTIFAKFRFVLFFLFTIPPAVGMLLSLLPMRKRKSCRCGRL